MSDTPSAKTPVPAPDLAWYDGLYVLDHFLGRKLVNRLLLNARIRRRERLLSGLRQRPGVRQPVDRVVDISHDEFISRYLRPGRPLVFAGAALRWPCVGKWTLDFFQQRHGEQSAVVLPAARTTSGFAGTRDDESTRQDSFDALIQQMKAAPDAPYIRFSTIVEDQESLRADLDLDWIKDHFGPLPFGHRIHTFLGAAKSRTRLHADFPPNLFVQVYGRKHWILYQPECRAIIDPLLERSALSYTCNFEVREPFITAESLCHHLDSYEATLEPGDVLFNPAYMWHDVINLSDSIGVSVRWLSPGIHLRASWVMQLLNLFSTNPPVWRAGLKKRDFNANLLSSKNNAKGKDPTYRG